MAETSKAYERRIREGFFRKYIKDPGIDIGCAYFQGQPPDALNETFRRYDILYGDSDATYMAGIPDETFKTVYASHVLEHLDNPIEAIKNWYRILKPKGYLIIDVPHMVLYEKKYTLPSRWNGDHKTYWIKDESDIRTYEIEMPSNTDHIRSLKDSILIAVPNCTIVDLRTLDENYTANDDNHAGGEYSIEAIIFKP